MFNGHRHMNIRHMDIGHLDMDIGHLYGPMAFVIVRTKTLQIKWAAIKLVEAQKKNHKRYCGNLLRGIDQKLVCVFVLAAVADIRRRRTTIAYHREAPAKKQTQNLRLNPYI